MVAVQSPDKDESLNQQISLSVAELFTNARKAQGYSIEDIARHLRVARSYIEAIESNSTSGLPSRVYALGFIRSYANFLNQDSDHFVKRFKEEVLGDPVHSPSLSFPATLTLDSSPQKNILWLSSGVLIIILSLGLGFWHWGPHSKPESNLEEKFTADPLKENLALELSKEDPPSSSSNFSLHSANTIEQPSENTKPEDLPSLPQPPSTPLASPAQASLPFPSVENSLPLKLTFSEACWLRVQNEKGQVVLEKTFQEGDQYTIPRQNNYILSTGNAGAIEISSSLMPEAKILGKKGQVIQNLSLDSQALSAYLNQQ